VRGAAAACLAACAALAVAPSAAPVLAQRAPPRLSATLDAAAAAVDYDGFLPSAALSMTPALQLDVPLATLTARGTYLVFESGNRSLQGLVAASAFTPAAGPLRGEVAGTVGGSSYERSDEPTVHFNHALGRARVHLMGGDRGAYAGAAFGRSALDVGTSAAVAYGVGGWRRLGATAVDLSLTATRVGGLRYTDAEATLRWAKERVDVDAAIGARGWSRGAGRGVYGEAVATYWLTPHLAVVGSGGRYATDPTRGSLAGRYVAVALRIAHRAAPAASLSYLRPYRTPGERGARGVRGVKLPGVEVVAAPGGGRTLRIRMPGAARVTLMGDFTDWTEVALAPAGGDVWELTLPLAPGSYRFNVRADGGAWVVPTGVTAFADDFGGIVAVVVVK